MFPPKPWVIPLLLVVESVSKHVPTLWSPETDTRCGTVDGYHIDTQSIWESGASHWGHTLFLSLTRTIYAGMLPHWSYVKRVKELDAMP